MLTKGAVALSAKLAPLMTAAELARRLKVTPQAVSGWIKGKAIPTPETLRAIEDALGIPMRAWTEPAEK